MLRVAEKTTADARRVLKIAQDTREIGVNTLVTLHEQGEQIRRTHQTAVQVDQELSKVTPPHSAAPLATGGYMLCGVHRDPPGLSCYQGLVYCVRAALLKRGPLCLRPGLPGR